MDTETFKPSLNMDSDWEMTEGVARRVKWWMHRRETLSLHPQHAPEKPGTAALVYSLELRQEDHGGF